MTALAAGKLLSGPVPLVSTAIRPAVTVVGAVCLVGGCVRFRHRGGDAAAVRDVVAVEPMGESPGCPRWLLLVRCFREVSIGGVE